MNVTLEKVVYPTPTLPFTSPFMKFPVYCDVAENVAPERVYCTPTILSLLVDRDSPTYVAS